MLELLPPLKTNVSPEDGPFSGDMLIFGGYLLLSLMFTMVGCSSFRFIS